ncbi:Uncharacterised protein [Burkholderia cepacia]|uniref:Uncharacterized protein n=1 Tax=Burkholderia cepacia TaxID=292 RepID=A0AAE8N9R5_BURCE|nr:hypothetical protein CSX04_04411 [Burkholderia cepacia]SPV11955.1 Uncharacterised protein [Burkholderia cepacia]
MNEHHVCAVVRITARFAARFAARFPTRRVAGRAARPSKVTVPRFKEPRHV